MVAAVRSVLMNAPTLASSRETIAALRSRESCFTASASNRTPS